MGEQDRGTSGGAKLTSEQLDALAGPDLLPDPGDVGVDLLVAAPGVEMHGLALGQGLDALPIQLPRLRHAAERGHSHHRRSRCNDRAARPVL
jgi:hypothetical protein